MMDKNRPRGRLILAEITSELPQEVVAALLRICNWKIDSILVVVVSTQCLRFNIGTFAVCQGIKNHHGNKDVSREKICKLFVVWNWCLIWMSSSPQITRPSRNNIYVNVLALSKRRTTTSQAIYRAQSCVCRASSSNVYDTITTRGYLLANRNRKDWFLRRMTTFYSGDGNNKSRIRI